MCIVLYTIAYSVGVGGGYRQRGGGEGTLDGTMRDL
jgi:hypothetical protein